MSDPFPIPILWTTRLADMEWVVHPPVLVDGVLLVRVRKEVFRVRAADGELLGRTVVDPDNGRGILCLGHPACAIVDAGNAGKGESAVVAVDREGEVRWRTALEMQLLADTGALDGGDLLLCAHQAGVGNWLLTLDAATGAIRERTALPRGGVPSTALRWGRGTALVASPAGGPGLFTLGGDGQAGVIDERRIQRLVQSGERALVAARPDDETYELALYAHGTGEPRWRMPAPGFACAIDGGDVACLVGEGGEARAALRAAADGEFRWQAAGPFEHAPTRAVLAGALALFAAGTRVWMYRRGDGALLGDSRHFGAAAIAHQGRLYIGGREHIAAADLAGV